MRLVSICSLLFLPSTLLSFVILPDAPVFQIQSEAEARAKLLAQKPDKQGVPSLSTTHRAASDEDGDPLPIVIWHGLGDSADADGLKEIASLLDDIHPGTYVHIISLGQTVGSADRSQSFFGNLTNQIDRVCHQLADDRILSTAPAIDAIGFSQGGQFLRGYIERCGHWAPKVRSLITFGSQHNGIAEFQKCESATDWVCQGANALLKSSTVWSSFVQNRLVPAQYYRDTEDWENYLAHSNFLADVNNERELKNETYADNLAAVEKMVMVVFKHDKTVIPPESGWFSEVEVLKDGEKEIRKVTSLKDRKIYKEDWIGLKTLDEKGGLVFEEVEGEHMQLKDRDLKKLFNKYFGEEGKKFDDEDEKWKWEL
jgi:palmitoyl-protein thioesterase